MYVHLGHGVDRSSRFNKNNNIYVDHLLPTCIAMSYATKEDRMIKTEIKLQDCILLTL